jgi:hypothetical protein
VIDSFFRALRAVIDSFYLAARYLLFHRVRSVTVVACLVLVAALPIGLERILTESERQLMARADTTPLLLGSKGSSLDLVMSAVYFGGQTPDPISLAEIERIEEADLAYAIPIHMGFSARGAPIVGTSVDYLDYRELTVAQRQASWVEPRRFAHFVARIVLRPRGRLSPEDQGRRRSRAFGRSR